MRIGLCTGGGDCPGLNAAIRAVVKCAERRGIEVEGILNSFHGLIQDPIASRQLKTEDVSEILHKGGTILGQFFGRIFSYCSYHYNNLLSLRL